MTTTLSESGNRALQKLRAQYPQYDDLDDSTLAARLVAKYPQYKDLFHAEDEVQQSDVGQDQSQTQQARSELPAATLQVAPAHKSTIISREVAKRDEELKPDVFLLKQAPVASPYIDTPPGVQRPRVSPVESREPVREDGMRNLEEAFTVRENLLEEAQPIIEQLEQAKKDLESNDMLKRYNDAVKQYESNPSPLLKKRIEALQNHPEIERARKTEQRLRDLEAKHGGLFETMQFADAIIRSASPDQLAKLERKKQREQLKTYATKALQEIEPLAEYDWGYREEDENLPIEQKTERVQSRKNLIKARDKLREIIDYTGKEGFLEGIRDNWQSIIPYLKEVNQVAEALKIGEIAKKKERSPDEQALLDSYMALRQFEQTIERSSGYNIGSGLATLAGYAGAFGMTLPVQHAVRGVLRNAVVRWAPREIIEASIKGSIPEQLAGKIVTRAIPSVAGGTIQSFTNVPGIVAEAQRRMIDEYNLALSPEGKVIERQLKGNADEAIEAYLSSLGMNAAEYVTETWGVMAKHPLDLIKKSIIGRFMVKRGITSVDKALNELRKVTRWDGIIPEVFEEIANAPLSAAADRRSWAPLVPFTKESGYMTPEQIMETAAIVSIPGAVGVSARVGARAISRKELPSRAFGEAKGSEELGREERSLETEPTGKETRRVAGQRSATESTEPEVMPPAEPHRPAEKQKEPTLEVGANIITPAGEATITHLRGDIATVQFPDGEVEQYDVTELQPQPEEKIEHAKAVRSDQEALPETRPEREGGEEPSRSDIRGEGQVKTGEVTPSDVIATGSVEERTLRLAKQSSMYNEVKNVIPDFDEFYLSPDMPKYGTNEYTLYMHLPDIATLERKVREGKRLNEPTQEYFNNIKAEARYALDMIRLRTAPPNQRAIILADALDNLLKKYPPQDQIPQFGEEPVFRYEKGMGLDVQLGQERFDQTKYDRAKANIKALVIDILSDPQGKSFDADRLWDEIKEQYKEIPSQVMYMDETGYADNYVRWIVREVSDELKVGDWNADRMAAELREAKLLEIDAAIKDLQKSLEQVQKETESTSAQYFTWFTPVSKAEQVQRLKERIADLEKQKSKLLHTHKGGARGTTTSEPQATKKGQVGAGELADIDNLARKLQDQEAEKGRDISPEQARTMALDRALEGYKTVQDAYDDARAMIDAGRGDEVVYTRDGFPVTHHAIANAALERGAKSVKPSAITKNRIIPLDIEGNELVDLDGTPVNLNSDGTITLFHRTTPEAAAEIQRTGKFRSLENTNEIFFSTKPSGQAEGYGESVVAVRVRPADVRLDDAFHDGEIHVAVNTDKLGKANIRTDGEELRGNVEEPLRLLAGERAETPTSNADAVLAQLNPELRKSFVEADFESLPEELKSEELRRQWGVRGRGKTMGLYYRGKVYYAKDATPDTILHEAAHLVIEKDPRNFLRRLFGEEHVNPFLDAVWRDRENEIKNAEWYSRYINGDPRVYNPDTVRGRRNLANEYIAHLSQEQDQPLWERLIAWLRTMLRRIVPDLKWTDAELKKFVRDGYSSAPRHGVVSTERVRDRVVDILGEDATAALERYGILNIVETMAEVPEEIMRLPGLNYSQKVERLKVTGTAKTWVLRNEALQTVDFSTIKTKEDAANFAEQRFRETLSDEAIARLSTFDAKSYLDNLVSHLDENAHLPANVRQAVELYKSGRAKEAVRRLQADVQRYRQDNFKRWREYLLTENDIYRSDPFFRDIVAQALVRSVRDTHPDTGLPLNQGALATVYQTLSDGVNLRFEKLYSEALLQSTRDNVEIGDLENGWIKIPMTKKNDPKFKEAVAKVQAVSRDNWCTKTYNAAPYIQRGDFWVYVADKKPVLAVRFDDDNTSIGEIQGPANDGTIPAQYADKVEDLVNSGKLVVPTKTKEALRLALQKQRAIRALEAAGAQKVVLRKGEAAWVASDEVVYYRRKDGKIEIIEGSVSFGAADSDFLKDVVAVGDERIAIYDETSAPALTTVSGDIVMYKDATAPALTTVGGNVILDRNATAPALTTVGGDVTLYTGASVPALTTVGGDVSLYEGVSAPALTTVGGSVGLDDRANAPALTTVGGDVLLRENASAPALTTVGGDVLLYENATAPALMTVGGNVILNDRATAPALTTVGGSITLSPSATATVLTTVGRDVRLYQRASAPALTTVGGTVTLFTNASAPALTTVGKDVVLYENASAPALTTVGRHILYRDYRDDIERVSAPALAMVPSSVRQGVGRKEALRGTALDPRVKAKQKAKQKAASISVGRKVQGLTADGRIYLVASHIGAGTESGVLLHEAFHAFVRNSLGEKAWNDLMQRLSQINDPWVRRARERARLAGVENITEEIAAYAIEEYENTTPAIKKWVDSFLAAIKNALSKLRNAPLPLTPVVLRRLAITALKNAPKTLQPKITSRSKSGIGSALTQMEAMPLFEIKRQKFVAVGIRVGEKVYRGKPGMIHADLLGQMTPDEQFRYLDDPNSHYDYDGFIDENGEFVTRREVSAIARKEVVSPDVLRQIEGEVFDLTQIKSVIQRSGGYNVRFDAGFGEPLVYFEHNGVVDADGKHVPTTFVRRLEDVNTPEKVKRIVAEKTAEFGGPLRQIQGETKESFYTRKRDSRRISGRIHAGASRIGSRPFWDGVQRVVQDYFVGVKRLQESVGQKIPELADVYLKEMLQRSKAQQQIQELVRDYVEPLKAEIVNAHAAGVTLDDIRLFGIARHAAEANAKMQDENQRWIQTIVRKRDAAQARGNAKLVQKYEDQLRRMHYTSGMMDRRSMQKLHALGIDVPEIEGMSIAEDILADYSKEQADALARVMDKLYAINQYDLQNRLKMGLISQEYYDDLKESFHWYIPLKGFDAEREDESKPRVGHGLSVGGREYIARKGRTSLAGDIISYTIGQAEEGIIRGRKNEVQQAMLEFVKAYPDPASYEIITPYFVVERDIQTGNVVLDEETGKVVYRAVFRRPPLREWQLGNVKRVLDEQNDILVGFDMEMLRADNIVPVKVGGKSVYIRFKDTDLARTIKRLDVAQVPSFLNAVRAFMDYLRSVRTTYSPEFGPVNLLRDLGFGLTNIAAERSFADAFTVLRNVPNAMRGIIEAERGKVTSQWGQFAMEFKRHGGAVSWVDLQAIDAKTMRLVKEIDELTKRSGWVVTKRLLRKLGRAVELYNRVLELSTRVAAYKMMRDSGASAEKAAAYAKELTVNFERRGVIGAWLNFLWMFSNAGIQGTKRLLQPFVRKDTRTRAIRVASALVLGSLVLQELIRFVVGKDDDDEWIVDKLSDYAKYNTIYLPRFWTADKQDFVRFPLPYGANVFWVIGHILSDTIHHGFDTKRLWSAVAAIADSFNPLGTEEGSTPLRTVVKQTTPTLAKPFIEQAMNENFTGRPIIPEWPWDKRPESQRFYAGTRGTVYHRLTEWMHDNDLLEVSPELLEHWVDFFGGTAGKFVDRTVNDLLLPMVSDQKEFDIERAPMIRRFLVRVPRDYDLIKFREESDEIERVNQRFRDAIKERDAATVSRLMRDKRPLLAPLAVTASGELQLDRDAADFTGRSPSLEVQRRSVIELLRDLRRSRDSAAAAGNTALRDQIRNEMNMIAREFNREKRRRVMDYLREGR